jgi:hypothetical protein
LQSADLAKNFFMFSKCDGSVHLSHLKEIERIVIKLNTFYSQHLQFRLFEGMFMYCVSIKVSVSEVVSSPLVSDCVIHKVLIEKLLSVCDI